jgi:hypothetical protein
MRRIVVATAVALVGVVFIVMTFTQNLFRVGTDFEELITDFRPILEDESLAAYQAGIDAFGAVGTEFQTALIPGLSLALGMSPDQMQAYLAEQYPAVARGMAALPQLSEQFGGLLDLLAQQQENFRSADAIPTTSLPAQTVPWGFLLIGLIAVGLGVLMWFWRLRLGSLVAMVLGLLIVIGSFLLSLPGKAADADDLNEALKPAYTTETVEGAQAGLVAMGQMAEQMGTEMLPALATQLGMTSEELNAFLADGFPATAQAMANMGASLAGFEALASVFEANLENYETLRPVAFSPIIWVFIGGGFVLALAGAYGFFAKDREEVDAA